MPNEIAIYLLVESVLIALTVTLLVQPRFMFKPEPQRARATATAMVMGGWIALCVMFCWSVFLGMKLAFYSLTFRL